MSRSYYGSRSPHGQVCFSLTWSLDWHIAGQSMWSRNEHRALPDVSFSHKSTWLDCHPDGTGNVNCLYDSSGYYLASTAVPCHYGISKTPQRYHMSSIFYLLGPLYVYIAIKPHQLNQGFGKIKISKCHCMVRFAPNSFSSSLVCHAYLELNFTICHASA